MKMVRVVYRNISYSTELKIYDPKLELWRKIENIRWSHKKRILIKNSLCSIMEFIKITEQESSTHLLVSEENTTRDIQLNRRHFTALRDAVLNTSKDLKTSACTAAGRPHSALLEIFKKIPTEVMEKFYGCGAPLPLGIDGLAVLDLGSGSGRDCYAAAALVGEKGRVTGIDMTAEQLVTARKYNESFCKQTLGYQSCNLEFVEGYIEKLSDAGIPAESYDLVISNCVVNLSPDKRAVLKEVYRALKVGGEFYFSDVYCDRRLPKHVTEHKVLWGECIGGALYTNDFIRFAREVGFDDPRVLSSAPITVDDPELQAITGEAKFYSITYRLFKLPLTL